MVNVNGKQKIQSADRLIHRLDIKAVDSRQIDPHRSTHPIPQSQTASDDWQQKSIQEKLRLHAQFYEQTGQVSLPVLEIVARMAAEGVVFVPDRAETLIAQMTTKAQTIQTLGLQLQQRLDQICDVRYYDVNFIRQQILQLAVSIHELTKAIEGQIIPLIPLSPKWGEQVRSQLSALASIHAYLETDLEDDIQAARANGKAELFPALKHISAMNSATQTLTTCAASMIRDRVPLYHTL